MPSLRSMLGAAVAMLIAVPLLATRLRRGRPKAAALRRLGDPMDIARQLNNALNNASKSWPTFSEDPATAAVFAEINAQLATESPGYSLWDGWEAIDALRIQGIRDRYAASHSLSPSEAHAWNSVMAELEYIFGLRSELNCFLEDAENVLTEMVTWLGETIPAVSTLAALDQTTVVQVGNQSRSIWQIVLAPLQLVPQVGSTVNTILNGVVTLCTSDDRLVPNPAYQAIEATTAGLQIAAARDLGDILENIGKLRTKAYGDYGKLEEIHRLLVTPETRQSHLWSRDQFSRQSLNAAEAEIWKPILAVGWRVQIPTSFNDASPNTRIPASAYPAFQALQGALDGSYFFYDQVAGPFHEDFSEDFYTARCLIIGLDGGTTLSEAAARRLFVDLAVPRDDVFNGKNGWSLGVTDRSVHFKDYPYCYRIM